MHLADRRRAYRTILAQFVITLTTALLLLVAVGGVFAYSGLAGGMIATLANALFAHRVFVRYTAQQPGKLLARFYGAEILKLVLTGLLFAGVILWIKPLSVGALFGVFLLIQLMPIVIVQFLD
ncbi:MAG: ATP synthase subunit I [Sedimenticola sp.]|uniref:F0F1 ATP synthase subunit I n=1 Tax=Sedimenticola thiotaurini TaxID=1543721 RepID=A0A558DFC4_9GAMM|nr:ATP synthase subunit I [Sedimenticola sp.]MCW8948211.1 ATP synthase subunit I [Sedimenticola sp.]MCW9022531.1 ATP synthase subunit I [Sedimenticola sp.]MDF1527649.1 ATP synthase subunit I [Sedimenticola sp.]TVT59735.1 MAG: F0F1 ATP synthase subunit I [Sedimenticola thiotaurini]